MWLGLHMAEFPGRARGQAASRWVSWRFMLRGGLLALLIIFALSTQLLFQFDLYDDWALQDILLGWLDHFVEQLIVGVCIFAAVIVAVLVPANSRAAKHFLLLTSITLGALAGEALLMLRVPLPPGISMAGVLFAKVARWLVISGLTYVFLVFQRQAADAATQAHETELQRIQIDRQMTEARLQSLRAQIEPHFLFNTLANVQQLYRTEPERGRKMLGNFVAYLRAALPQMRHDETTLEQEVDLARAYLAVLQVRMGRRLDVRLDIPNELAALPFPPLALATLTENAIKHGLNPLPEGGAIEVTARAEDGRLRVSVADTGAGLQHNSGTGAGIANLRARLAALYGDSGMLAFEANVPRGIRATIVVPLKTAGIGGD
jgi:signal transduction histidine kinase